MSNKLFDTSRIRNREPSGSPKRRSLSPPRRNPEYSTQHQYGVKEGELFTVMIYDKEHDASPYLHYWVVNAPWREVAKGRIVCQLEKIPLASRHRYNIDFYRQEKRIQADVTYPDEKRANFP